MYKFPYSHLIALCYYLLGETPVYCEPGSYGVLSKITRRLYEFKVMDQSNTGTPKVRR